MIYTLAVVVIVLLLGATFFLRYKPSKRIPATPSRRDFVPPEKAPASGLSERIETVTPPDISNGTGRARQAFSRVLSRIAHGSAPAEQLWEELEETLLLSDLGLPLTLKVIESARSSMTKSDSGSNTLMLGAIRNQLESLFLDVDRQVRYSQNSPTVWLVVGVNGVGKTTSIGKLSNMARLNEKKVVLAAGDTFRAAAADQLQMWAERTMADIVRSVPGADPSSVVYDAIQKAYARNFDLVIADTAGRLHTKSNLMEELKKLRRISEKDPGNLTEVLLVLDATTGQNGLAQAREFTQAAGVTGIVLTKLDGSAKGGIALAVEAELAIPIKLVGIGEKMQDLISFSPGEFLDSLLNLDDDRETGNE